MQTEAHFIYTSVDFTFLDFFSIVFFFVDQIYVTVVLINDCRKDKIEINKIKSIYYKHIDGTV